MRPATTQRSRWRDPATSVRLGANDDIAIDAAPPTVGSVNQATGQADPTNASPINFTVVFSEPVIGFVNTDVVIFTGTATGTKVVTVTGAGPTYNVGVTGMSERHR